MIKVSILLIIGLLSWRTYLLLTKIASWSVLTRGQSTTLIKGEKTIGIEKRIMT